MIVKNHKHRGKGVKVTFSIPVEWLDRDVSVVGDFNGWDPTADPLRKRGSSRSTSVVLDPGSAYAFRYLDAAGRWHDDPSADDVRFNENGTTDCIIDLRDRDPHSALKRRFGRGRESP